MANEVSITDHKAAFIRAQVRLLSAPIKTSPSWQDLGPSLEEGQSSLSDKTVQDIVSKVNSKIKSHNRLVFSSQSQRHVAEQIDTLFWNTVTADDLRTALNATWLKRDVDLCEADTIALLPEKYTDLYLDPDTIPLPQDSNRYESLRKKLLDLSSKREDQSRKLAMYRQLQHLLQPYVNAQENIQPNLVTKDGELSKELDRTRMLVARVMSRVNDIQPRGTSSSDEDVVSNDEKLARILGLG